ncbi:MAG: potassium channel family protein, partial [Planctomycetota bacterium]
LDCYYYSFTTLTTLGYGDIAPVTSYAKILAVTEAVVGPIFIAIFIAQLVAMNMASKLREEK